MMMAILVFAYFNRYHQGTSRDVMFWAQQPGESCDLYWSCPVGSILENGLLNNFNSTNFRLLKIKSVKYAIPNSLFLRNGFSQL